jgi:hypothetical protein
MAQASRQTVAAARWRDPRVTAGHTAVRKFPAEPLVGPVGGDDDLVVLQADVDLIARVKLNAITDRLGNLAFRPGSAGHTSQV